jgi:XTP/dITP diphosphohydrolase
MPETTFCHLMETLIFATNNPHKVEEVRSVLKDRWDILTLKDAGIHIDIPEPHNTLEANAREKSFTIYQLTGRNCFSEDTGLEVSSLGGAPGVKSARYAGEKASYEDNTRKLLDNMQSMADRSARFRTIISLVLDGAEYQFEGICPGIIIEEKKGGAGFGFDPVFVPDGDTRTFAEMNTAEKNNYSHRKKAMDKLIYFLANKNGR